ncbi:MAG: glycosyltransferase family 2 protein [Thermoplasmata archaeon]
MTDRRRAHDSPKISVIILNYNGIEFIVDCLDSVLSSVHPSFEVIVVDNASTDGSVEQVKSRCTGDPRLRMIPLDENVGSARGNNVGVRHARGGYVVFLNPDTRVNSHWLTELIDVMERDETIAAAQAKLMSLWDPRRLDSAGIAINPMGLEYLLGHGVVDRGQFDELGEILAASGAAMMTRKDVLEEVGGFDPSFFMYFEDTDLCWRMRLVGYKIVLAPKAAVLHWRGGSAGPQQGSSLVYHSTRNHLRMWIKNLGWSRLVRYLPLSLAYFVGSSVRDIIARGRTDLGVARIRSLVWVLRNLSLIWPSRKKVQNSRKASDRQLFGRLRLSPRGARSVPR